MNAEEFITWLKGYIDIHGSTPSDDEWDKIKEKVQDVAEFINDKNTLKLEPVMPGTSPSPLTWPINPVYPNGPTWREGTGIIC